MFTWEKSPSCVKAVEAFDMMNVDYKIVRLDDPWSKGNPIRAELGKRVGRTSVPFVFIDGKYVGGYDGGLDGDASAPGMVKMAFQGTLRSSLEKVGALK
jgi:glutaredoxin